MRADEYLDQLQKIGWLETYSDERLAQLRDRLKSAARTSEDDFALELGFPLLDHEEILSQDYCALLVRAYEEASNGQFSPTDVSFDRQKRGPARLSFRAAGTEFSRSFPYEFGTIESAVHDLVNEALGAAGSPYRFFQLPGADVMGVALVRPKVFEQASQLGLLRTSWWGGEAAQRGDAPDGALS